MPGLFIERHAKVASRFASVTVLAIIPSREMSEIEIEKEDNLLTLRYYFKLGQTEFRFVNKLLNQLRWWSALLKGYRMVRREMNGFDMLHVNVLTRLGLFALLIHCIENIPYVITEHWTRYINGSFKGALRIAVTRLVVRKAQKVSTVTDNLWKAMQTYGIANANHMVLQNVVDDAFFNFHNISDESIIPSPGRFVHISCFTDRSKNISGLLRVLSRLSASNVDFECILVGDGEDWERMKLYAESLDLRYPKVQFKGLLTGNPLVQVMHSASFLVLFSNYENMPVVINEAFAVGIPVIATDTGGINEQVKEWNGCLVSVQDEDALYSAILSFLKRSPEFDPEKLKRYAACWFSSDAVENQLKSLYGLQ
ncbi:MAG: glycosyltransferase [Bacteroidota bacterium]|nr:glycosyltransferase [Bacteroidota bacterium]